MKKYIIFGAQFENKGAEAMLFTCIDAIKRNNPQNSIIVLLQKEEIIPRGFMEETLCVSLSDILFIRRSILKSIWPIEYDLNVERIKSVFENADCFINISGYQISDHFAYESNLLFVELICYAKECGLQVHLMPQSYGPSIRFGLKKTVVLKWLLKRALKMVDSIYVREKSGAIFLRNQLKVKNCFLESDIVLQHKEYNLNNIINDYQEKELDLWDNNMVAVVPSIMLKRVMTEEAVELLYVQIINYLISINKNVLVVVHSSDDLPLIEVIVHRFHNIKVIREELYCFEYETIFSKCDYVIASRYHSIIHSLKKETPCVVIGWANKYFELMKSVSQDRYLIDEKFSTNISEICKIISVMNSQFSSERVIIAKILENIMQDKVIRTVLAKDDYD